MATLLAKRAAAIATVVAEVGGYFSIENPASSIMWDLEPYKALTKLPGVKAKHVDMCMYASVHRKPTVFLTNAPGSTRLRVPRWLRMSMTPWTGRVMDYASGNMVWLTELAAEYPEDGARSRATTSSASSSPA